MKIAPPRNEELVAPLITTVNKSCNRLKINQTRFQ